MSIVDKARPFAGVVAQAARETGLSTSLINAVIAQESQFDPNAYRAEVKIGDASRGLMQLLLSTARANGYARTDAGEPAKLGAAGTGLYDPQTNVSVGARFLASLIRARNNDVRAAVSAYNNGNGKRATTDTVVVDARDQKTGAPIQTHVAKAGDFLNQPYVDAVFRYYEQFTTTTAVELAPVVSSPLARGSLHPLVLLAGGIALVAGVVWAVHRSRS